MSARRRPRGRTKRSKIGAAAGLLLLTLSTPASAGNVARLKPLTIEDVTRRQPEVQTLFFQGADLFGTLKAPDQAPTLAALGPSGVKLLASGASGSISPDGRWLLYLASGQWRLRNLKTGQERHFDVATISATPQGLPVWSRDSAAVAAHYDLPAPPPLPTAPQDGIHVQVLEPTPEAIRARATKGSRPNLLLWRVAAAQPSIIGIDATEAYPGDWLMRGREPTYVYAAGQIDYGGQPPSTVIEAVSSDGTKVETIYRTRAFNQALRPSRVDRWPASGLHC